jgi:hypothetical protein
VGSQQIAGSQQSAVQQHSQQQQQLQQQQQQSAGLLQLQPQVNAAAQAAWFQFFYNNLMQGGNQGNQGPPGSGI